MRRFGLHPRWFHLVVNAPFLYGPLLLFLGGARKRNPFGKALDASAVLGLAALSVAPHQEPRFLLPMACAVFARAAPRVARLKWKRKFYVFWLVFHLAVAGFYTTIHQAGLVPLLRRVGAARGACDHVAFVGTYLPPYSVAGPRAGAELFLHDFENDAAGLGRRVAALKRELDGGPTDGARRGVCTSRWRRPRCRRRAPRFPGWAPRSLRSHPTSRASSLRRRSPSSCWGSTRRASEVFVNVEETILTVTTRSTSILA